MDIIKNVEYIKDSSDESFLEDVVETSQKIPVFVDFWAPWCGPCKSLGPFLEEETKFYKGSVSLVKINIDENPNIAGQLRVQSIPAVFVFVNGQPVDGFMGAQTKDQVKSFFKKIIETYDLNNNNDHKNNLKLALDLIASGKLKDAKETLFEIIKEDNTIMEAHKELIKINILEKNINQAKENLKKIPDNLKNSTDFKSLEAQINIFEDSKDSGDINDLRKKIHNNPNELNLKFELAVALIGKSENEEAIEILLNIFATNPEWEDGKSKKQLLKLLDSLDPKDNLAKSGRRRLTSLIFT